jgi:putative flippase GtrA
VRADAARSLWTLTDSSVVRYLGVGVLSYGVDLGLLALGYSVLGWPLWVATSVGFWTSFAVNFGLNRVLTFRSTARAGWQLVRYSLLVAVNYLASLLIVGLAEHIGAGYAVGKTASVGILVIVNYAAYRWWVFT